MKTETVKEDTLVFKCNAFLNRRDWGGVFD